MEVSQSKVIDLIASTVPPRPLKIAHRKGIGTFVEGLQPIAVNNQADLETTLAAAESRRKVVSGFPLAHIAYSFYVTSPVRYSFPSSHFILVDY
jgi:hypothetical protein